MSENQGNLLLQHLADTHIQSNLYLSKFFFLYITKQLTMKGFAQVLSSCSLGMLGCELKTFSPEVQCFIL